MSVNLADVNSKGKNEVQLFPETHSCADSRTKAVRMSVTFESQKKNRDVHMTKLLQHVSPKHRSNTFTTGKWQVKRNGLNVNTENFTNTSFCFPVLRH